MAKTDEKWVANYEALKACIDEHHHLPPKNTPLGAKFCSTVVSTLGVRLRRVTVMSGRRRYLKG